MYEQSLIQAGLTKNQALIYEVLVKNGPLPAGKVAKNTPLKRGLVYKILDELVQNGLVSEKNPPNKAATFEAAHPLKLKELAEKQEQEAKDAQTALASVLTGLTSDYNLAAGKPGVQFFEGKEGIIKAYESLLDENKPIDSIEDKGEMMQLIPEYAKKFVKERVRKGIFNRVVCPSANAINKNEPAELRETRQIPVNKYPLSMDIKMVGNKVSLITFKKDTAVGVLIEHPEIAENFRILFNYFWDTSGSKPQAARFNPAEAPKDFSTSS